MFTTNAKLDIRSGFAATLYTHFNQRANAFRVNRYKRINRINILFGIIMQEGSCIITADAKRCLGQVIRAKREEFGSNR